MTLTMITYLDKLLKIALTWPWEYGKIGTRGREARRHRLSKRVEVHVPEAGVWIPATRGAADDFKAY
jgi:hypothetical protein